MKNYVKKAKRFIEQNYKSISKLSDISNNISCNYNTLRCTFVRETGVTLVYFINITRCKKAEYLLKNTDLKLYSIAIDVGYHDEKYFIKVFKRIYGCSPSEIRNRK